MKRFTLQLQSIDGTVEKESEVVIGDNDILVMQFPKDMPLQQAHKAFEMLSKAVESGNIVGLPNSITFKVIKKG
jgi:hypothetical protein